MDFKRLWRTIRLNLSNDKGKYLRRAHIFEYFGKNSTYASRKIPLYPELIYIGDNVRLAANVLLVPHDMAHAMLNNIITSRNLQPRVYKAFRPLSQKNHPLFCKKRLTNHSKFAAKPIDYILFQSTGGDFFVTY